MVKQRAFVLDSLGALGILVALVAVGYDARATTHYVSREGRNEYPYRSPEDATWRIQSAVDAAEEGDEVVVGPGEYTEHVVLKRGVNLSGSGPAQVKVYGVKPLQPVLTLAWDNAVKGLTVVGAPYAGVGIYAELGVPPSKTGTFCPFQIIDCSVQSCGGPGILVVATQEPGEVLTPDPQFATPEEWETYLTAIYDTELMLEVSRSEISGCGGGGITLAIEDLLGKYQYQVDTPIEAGFKHATLELSECTLADSTRNGVLVRAGWGDRARLIMEKCVVRDNTGHGLSVISQGAVWGGAVVEANNCVVSGNGQSAIWCFSIDDGVYEMPGGEVIGVEPSATGNVIVTSSTITGNSVGLVGAPFPPGLAAGGGAWIRVYDSIVYGNTQYDLDFRWFGEYAVWMTSGIVHSCVGWEELAGIRGNIASDPLFADRENNDFRLLAGSPCIDAGGMYWQPTIAFQDEAPIISWDAGKDLDGNPRISDAGPDMGAYESGGEAPDYLLESSADLFNWVEEYYGLATSWTDPRANSSKTKFYRVRVGR
jgi:hypothetical protein